MHSLKVLVVEDEILIADHICDYLKELGYEPLEPAINYTEALLSIQHFEPHFVILDINLSGKKTGIDVAQHIRKTSNIPFIFLTSNSDKQTIDEVKKVNPPAYLIKPFTKNDLYAAIELTLAKYYSEDKKQENLLFIKEKGIIKKIDANQIIAIKSEHVYIEIILKNDEKILLRKSLQSIENKLNNNFIRIHRSYIINTNFIKEVKKNTIIVDKLELPFSKKFKSLILNYIIN